MRRAETSSIQIRVVIHALDYEPGTALRKESLPGKAKRLADGQPLMVQ
jgi:hypothetical protein